MSNNHTTKMRHGLYLTVGPGDRDDLIAICSDGTPQYGHEGVTILTLKRVSSMKEAKVWFKRVRRERPWETRH